MIYDYFNDEKYVEVFVSKVDEESKLIEMAVGFYKEITDKELKNIPHINASLTKTNKKDEYGNELGEINQKLFKIMKMMAKNFIVLF